MILKLELPYYDRAVERGSIVKWHKAEGDAINFGDDIFDIKVEEITKYKRVKEGQAKTVDMVKGTVGNLEFYIRVTSSDMGVLRKIYAAEGQECDIGDLVAIVTTSSDEDCEIDIARANDAPAFRVITNVADGSTEHLTS
jgi:pyruvate/2-oxoglutarate dehydrogenase complex dihydrolipoamide acyltransferase (E2) component